MKKVGQIIRESITERIFQGVKNKSNAFVISYSRVGSSQMSNFRKDLSQVGADMYVSKNRIAKKALSDLELKDLGVNIQNQTAFVWSDSDSVEIAKVLMKYAKEFEGISVQGGVLEGRTVAQEEVQRLSDLPSREVLLAMLLQTIQSPLTRLAGALNGKTRELINLIKQLSEKAGGK
ncbi:MAG: 50S ribosomal protein L10 [Candidatus Aceula meridiana]|nr:50S ribosomal protein L10 [Candidatus Aceula meridiana]